MIKIYNTLSKQKEEFKPLKQGEVKMYVCGMTVYDLCHLGHARVLVIFDLIHRWFKENNYAVTYVRNITDIDDKIINKSVEQKITFNELTEHYIDEMNIDIQALNVLSPSHEPKATEHISSMITMIQTLVDKGFAYQAENKDVYYAVDKFAGYGKLSGKSLKDLQAGNRVDIDKNKRNVFDFVLWKSAKKNEPAWQSPWGKGRPGWHIECSAMSNKILGHHFDIHGGGQDLQFPHHENEIAQSEATNDCQMANYWIHNGFVKVDNEKMSKSLGNFFTIRSILELYDGEVVRFFILKAHYRSPLNYSDQHLDDARQGLTRLYLTIRDITKSANSVIDWNNSYAKKFKAALDDDFNSAEALSVLFDLSNEINKKNSDTLKVLLINLANILGLLYQNPENFLQGKDGLISDSDINTMIKKRNVAKQNRNYNEADAIREQLLSQGIILEDTEKGTIWRKK
ncbi:MAG: cysteine--tRNA ligase [Proteobacteria bacterium]|jgi:cysteinyl-tRNA synthetase|nr:cysteine--tRNA ligase [Pseudomonadota bacterium]MDA0872736.1 cysteine--tRNA ligase [Pseudomonadota bacterium]MDA1133391.1 cysteine--tRNA ligase [Pseudomonadota bacterium]